MFTEFPAEILRILLIDRTRTHGKYLHHLIWATSEYSEHLATSEIRFEDLKTLNPNNFVNSTPNPTIAYMNRLLDNQSPNFPINQNNWRAYVLEPRMEITCGLAPFIVDRRNLWLRSRIGFLDRKIQTVSQFCLSSDEWLAWVKNAYKSCYGYELRGDYFFLARVNLLKTFLDFWNAQFPNDQINLTGKLSQKHLQILHDLAEIISWNLFQMDGLKFTFPLTCRKTCLGCKKHLAHSHDGTYAKIMDWPATKVQNFVDLLK